MILLVACMTCCVGVQGSAFDRWLARFADTEGVQVRFKSETTYGDPGGQDRTVESATSLVEEVVLVWPDGLRHTSFFPGVHPAPMVPSVFVDYRVPGVEVVFGSDRLGSVLLRPAAGTFDGRRFESPVDWDIGFALTAYWDRLEWALAKAVLDGKIGELQGLQEETSSGKTFVFSNDHASIELREEDGRVLLAKYSRKDDQHREISVSEFTDFRDVPGLGPTAHSVVCRRTAPGPVPGESRHQVIAIAAVSRGIGECSNIDVGTASRLDRSTGDVLDAKGRVLGNMRRPGSAGDGSLLSIWIIATTVVVSTAGAVAFYRKAHKRAVSS